MKINMYFIFSALLFCTSLCLGQRTAKLVIDPVTHAYKISEISEKPSNARVTDYDISVAVTPYDPRPESMINIHIDFGANVDISKVVTINFSIYLNCGESCNAVPFAFAWLSTKAINKLSRSVDFVMGGMPAFKNYYLQTYIFGLEQNACSGIEVPRNYFTTLPASSPSKKMLMVIDEEWRNSSAVQAKLDQYITDVESTTPGLEVDRYYVQDNSYAKIDLYAYIRTWFLADNISYLFFIGDNASVDAYKTMLDDQGAPMANYMLTSFHHYTHPLYQHYTYDPATYDLRSTQYQNTCLYPPTEVRQAVFEQRNPLMSYGMIIPAPNLSPSAKVDYLVNYFTKLHQFRNREISFDKKAFLSDGTIDEQNAVEMAEANGRWDPVSTVSMSVPKDQFYSGEDPVWKADFLNKLANESFEIASLVVHGSPDYQSFGIVKEDINNLPRLNTQLLSLSSCNVGHYKSDNYLAGEYLGKGNVLNVHAYSDYLFLFQPNGGSGLEYEYRHNGAFTLMAEGMPISDAYRYGAGYSQAEMIFGDPLVKFQGPASALPVVLQNFNAVKEGNVTQLIWKTSSEINSSRFEIERSANGKKWHRVGEVSSSGESTSELGYVFTDKNPLSGENLYRLKMIDRDATFTFSQIRNVHFESVFSSVYPNPVSDKILFSTEILKNIQSVTILDASGKTVFETTALNANGISVNQFNTGLYTMRITKADGSVQTQKILVGK